MRFAGGTTQTTVIIDSTQKAALTLNNTGKLHEYGGALSLHRIAIHTDNREENYDQGKQQYERVNQNK